MHMSKQYDYIISGLKMRVSMPHDILMNAGFPHFTGNFAKPDIQIKVQEITELPAMPSQIEFSNEIFRVYREGGQLIRCYHDHTDGDRPYAVTVYDWETGTVQIAYLERDRLFFSQSQNTFSHIGFEEILISRDRLILHASLIQTEFGGILFSGVSGVGKSTQADLWKKYENAEVINGDRPILGRTEMGWTASGSPYAGSSQCYVNKSVPIRGIMMLEQGSTCSISRLSPAESFRRLYAETTINVWNEQYIRKVCDLLQELVISVPIYRFVCTPDQDAVNKLKKLLKKENIPFRMDIC